MTLFWFLLSLAGLWLGAQLTIQAALDIADHYKLSQAFVGLTILALGTDLPELFINTAGAIDKVKGIETSNLILSQTLGTTISQISLMLGLAALSAVITISKKGLARDAFMLIGSVVLIFLIALDGVISQTDGWLLIVLYLFYIVSLLRTEKIFQKFKIAGKIHIFWTVISLLSGLVLLVFASNVTITNALLLSQQWGVSQFIIGIVLVGLGTSLPELAASLVAVKKGASAMATGNLIGSNIFDLLFALGVGASISGFTVNGSLLRYDIPILLALSIIVVFLFKSRKTLDKKEAIFLIAFYILYIASKFAFEFMSI